MTLRLSYQTAALRICVDDIGNGFCGRITGQRLNAPISFSDINDFIIQVDELLDVQKYPRAFQRIRTFTDKESPSVPAVMTMEEMNLQKDAEVAFGAHSTFLLSIYSRQNACWQGSIDWMDGGEKQRFSSTLEFMRLIAAKLGL